MKRMGMFLIIVVMFVSFSSVGLAATKYDCIKRDPFYQKIISAANSKLSYSVLSDYINLLINMDDINRIIRDKSLDQEKIKFIYENKNEFLIYMQGMICGAMGNNLKRRIKDSEYIYITGVIKTHMSGQSITSPSKNSNVDPAKAQIEKALFEEHELYKVWLWAKKPGLIEALCDEQITNLYNKSKKR
jgi:hypothetical protein